MYYFGLQYSICLWSSRMFHISFRHHFKQIKAKRFKNRVVIMTQVNYCIICILKSRFQNFN